MTLGQNIARLRAQKNLSQGDLADALEVSRQSVSKWETDASIPELDKLLRLAELFGVTLDELVKGESAQPEAARGEAPDKESAGAYTAAAPAARRETRQIVGTILLCFGALIGILIMLFAGTLAGFILALPLFVCGARQSARSPARRTQRSSAAPRAAAPRRSNSGRRRRRR